MSFELLYTSAPKGLKQGSRGFTTVLCTEGMPANLISRLEALSGYRHVFTPQDAKYNDNPVAYSHLRVTSSGRARSILSRISSYGVDYSGRTNKLAHHLALDSSEQIAAGPAWPLLNGEALRTSWDGQLATPASGPRVRPADQTQAVCRTWQNLTGDAGWGGALAEHFAAPQARPRWILYSIDQQNALLGLINEAIALLPTAIRWQATFSTYATNLPPDVDCRLRCVLIDSPDARSVPVQSLLIDLTRPSALPVTHPLIDLARTGRKTVVQESAAVIAMESSVPTLSSPPAPILDDDAPYRMQPPAILPNAKPASRHGKPAKSGPPAVGPPPRPKARTYQYVLPATIAAVALLALGFGIFTLAKPNRKNSIASNPPRVEHKPQQTSSVQHSGGSAEQPYDDSNPPVANAAKTEIPTSSPSLNKPIDDIGSVEATPLEIEWKDPLKSHHLNARETEETAKPSESLNNDADDQEQPFKESKTTPPDHSISSLVIPLTLVISQTSAPNIKFRYEGRHSIFLIDGKDLNFAFEPKGASTPKSRIPGENLITYSPEEDRPKTLLTVMISKNANDDSHVLTMSFQASESSIAKEKAYKDSFESIGDSIRSIQHFQKKKMNSPAHWTYHQTKNPISESRLEEIRNDKMLMETFNTQLKAFNEFNGDRKKIWNEPFSSDINGFRTKCVDLQKQIDNFISTEEQAEYSKYRRELVSYSPDADAHLSIAREFSGMLRSLIEDHLAKDSIKNGETVDFGTLHLYKTQANSTGVPKKPTPILSKPIEVTLKITHIQIGGL